MSTIELIKLPFEEGALAPIISANTIALHYGKHLSGYVNNLNKMLSNNELEAKSLIEIVKKSQGSIHNNAGQVLNHNMYFEALRPAVDNNMPKGKIATAINSLYGSFENFKQEFAQKAVSLFGSGWVWLSSDVKGKLSVTQEYNANNPVQNGLIPLLTFDVWEHAYYVDYQNRRADYIEGLWNIVNWDVVESRYDGVGC